MKSGLLLITISTLNFLFGSPPVVALDPSLEIGQYAHTAWTVRDGFSLGAIYAMAQTPDGYLWLGGENGLFRFDGVHAVLWQPPAGQPLPDKPYSLLVTRDGTLWIGTYAGLVTWRDGKLTRYPEVGEHFVTSLLEDHEGTVWAGILGGSPGTPTGRLCAIRSGHAQCYGEDGAFGSFVWSLGEDRSGALWAGAESGLWRWKPGPPKLYAMPGMRIGDLTTADDGRLLVGVTGAGLKQIAGDKVESYPIPDATHPNRLLPDQDVDSNKLLRDRDGGLWIGTRERGLIHIHNGRTDILTKSGGLSGNIGCGLFEDREGTVWFASAQGLDRFRELPVTTISAEQGLSSDRPESVIAGTDGSVWVATRAGLTEWKNSRTAVFRKANGLPDDATQSLFQDDRGRIWVFTARGLAYFAEGKFVAVKGVPSEEVYSITGTRRATSGFPGIEGSRTCGMDVWSNTSPGQRWGVKNRLRLYSLTKAEFGFHSGPTGACCISRMVRFARRTPPRMGWVKAMSPVFNSIAMGQCGPEPRRAALAALKTAASLRSPAGMVCLATRFTGRSRTTIARCGCTWAAAWCASRALNWRRGSPTRRVGLKPRFGMRPTASRSARLRLPPSVLPSRSPPMANCGSCREKVSKSSIPVILLTTNCRRRYTSSKLSPTTRFIGRTCRARRLRICGCRR